MFRKIILFVFFLVIFTSAFNAFGQVQSQTLTTPAQLSTPTIEQIKSKNGPMSDTPTDKTFFTKTLRKNSKGEEVENLQISLSQFSDIYPQGIISGYFGPLTELAVKKFQKKYEIEQVGVVGPKTRTILNQGFDRLLKDEIKTPVPTKTEIAAAGLPPPSDEEKILALRKTDTPVKITEAPQVKDEEKNLTSTKIIPPTSTPIVSGKKTDAGKAAAIAGQASPPPPAEPESKLEPKKIISPL